MNTQLSKNKIAIVFIFLTILITVNAEEISVKPLVGYQNEELTLTLQNPSSIEIVEILAQYNQQKIDYCTQDKCPIFENNSLQLEKPEKNSYKILVKNSKQGDYLIKITFNDGRILFSSFAVKQNYSLLFALVLVALIGLLFGVEKNAFKF